MNRKRQASGGIVMLWPIFCRVLAFICTTNFSIVEDLHTFKFIKFPDGSGLDWESNAPSHT